MSNVPKEQRNIHKVNPRVWRRWSPTARLVFNRLYGCLKKNQANLTHPKGLIMKPPIWETIAWNTAWLAADAVMGPIEPLVVNDV